MLSIRLSRVGKKNQAQFRVVIQEHTASPTGKNIEFLGSYNPHTKEAIFKEERIKYWISKGAQLTDTVHNLLVSNKVIDLPKRAIKIKAKKKDEVEKGKEESKAEDKKDSVPVEIAEEKVEKAEDNSPAGGEKTEAKEKKVEDKTAESEEGEKVESVKPIEEKKKEESK